MLQPQEVLDLLPTTVEFPFPHLPYQPLHQGIYPSASPLAFLGLVMLIQEAQQSVSFDALYPEIDRLSILPNLSAMRVFGILCSCNSQHRVISVLSCMSMILHGLSDFYGNIAAVEEEVGEMFL